MTLTETQLTNIVKAVVANTKDATGTPAAPYAHGPGGLFSQLDSEHPVLSAMIQPQGLISVIPVSRADRHVTDKVPTFTGVTGDSGSEPTTACGDKVQAGLKKLCTLAVPMGRYFREAREWSALELAKLSTRTEELSLMAQFPQNLIQPDNLTASEGISSDGNSISRQELSNRLFEMAVSYQRLLGTQVYTGNPLNNQGVARNEGYKEIMGLDLWINAGNKRDYLASAVCTALDSFMQDFNYNPVDGLAPSIVRFITNAWRHLNWNARRMGLFPASWTIAMSPDLFHFITDIWPCSYLSNRCADSATGAQIVVVNDDKNRALRDAMFNGSFLWIDGVQVPVVQDMFIPEDTWITNANLEEGEYSSDIYFIPMTVLGGFQSTHFQYFDQRLNVGQNQITRDTRLWATDAGKYLWTSSNVSYCFKMEAAIEPRLIMHTPQLAARIENVMYAPDAHLRQHDPEDTYFRDGGVTNRPDEEFYNAWQDTPDTF